MAQTVECINDRGFVFEKKNPQVIMPARYFKELSLFEFFLYIGGVLPIQKYIIYLFIAYILFILLDRTIFTV
jgi:hypothetical protein